MAPPTDTWGEYRKERKVTLVALVGFAIALLSMPNALAENRPWFRASLNQFGYSSAISVEEYSSLGFLSDDLLIINVNQHGFMGTDAPPATLVVFDLKQQQVLRTTSMRVVKSSRSVVPLTDGRFAVLSGADLKICSADLRCERSFRAKGGLTGLSSDTLKAWAGTDNYVVRSDDESADGTRTVTSELSSTKWNKITHPLDIDEPTRPNSRRVTVRDTRTGEALLSLRYDPRNQLVGPAISPNGKRLAIVRKGFVEVYEMH
jgi:hypothetical protein